MAIPERGNAAGLAFPSKDGLSGGENLCGSGADEKVRAFGDGDGALGVFAEREAGDAERGGFFLDAAGVGQDQRGFAEET